MRRTRTIPTILMAAVAGAVLWQAIGLHTQPARAVVLEPTGQKAPQGTGSPPGTLQAREFQVVDTAGKTKATIGVRDDGLTALQMFDTRGKTRIILQVSPNGTPMVGLCDETGHKKASLHLAGNGLAMMILSGKNGQGRLVNRVTSKGKAEIALYDTGTQALWQAP